MLAEQVMEAGGAVRLGPFMVAPDGSLSSCTPEALPGFAVRWRGRTLRAAMCGGAGAEAVMTLDMVLGRVPSTACAPADPGLRERALGLVRALPGHLPQPWRLRLLASHQIGLSAIENLPAPVLAADLVAGLTRFLLRLGPYLDVLDEAGSGPAADAGMEKICPG